MSSIEKAMKLLTAAALGTTHQFAKIYVGKQYDKI